MRAYVAGRPGRNQRVGPGRESRSSLNCRRPSVASRASAATRHWLRSRPILLTAQAMAKAQKNCPVSCTTKPVTTGATIPAMLPRQFCTPAHLAAARGPASVCPIAKQVAELKPKDRSALGDRAADDRFRHTPSTAPRPLNAPPSRCPSRSATHPCSGCRCPAARHGVVAATVSY